MGIKGLLSSVEKSCRPSKIDEFYGKTVAVDACCWLYKGAFGCAEKLAKNEKTDFYVHYCLKYVRLLLSRKMHVILVFDGARLPAKQHTDDKRKTRRDTVKVKGESYLAEGKISEANKCFRDCCEVTFEMISSVIEACSNLSNVDCIIAPYEADAQLAYFDKEEIVQLIITDDSDLIVFGCTNIMFKMDRCGSGLLYKKEKLSLSLGLSSESFDFVKFRRACILAGCDYTARLAGVGIVEANEFFEKISGDDLREIMETISSVLQQMPNIVLTDNFVENFIEAENTFLYQIVFDIVSKQTVQLNSCCEDDCQCEPRPYAGRIVDKNLAYQLAIGNVHPMTHEKVNNFDPACKVRTSRSIWKGNFCPSADNVDVDDTVSSQISEKSPKISAFATSASRFINLTGEDDHDNLKERDISSVWRRNRNYKNVDRWL